MINVMTSILQQIKERRKSLNLKQSDMMMRLGMSRQQYQRLESKGNPRLDTLELIAKGLNSELMLVPKEQLTRVQALLEDQELELGGKSAHEKRKSLSDDPWQDLLGNDR